MGKGACITRTGAVRKLQYKHYNGKKTNRGGGGGGGGVKNMKFVQVLKK